MRTSTVTGGCDLTGHPAVPVWQAKCPSSWYLTVMAAMCFMLAAEISEFDQRVPGQESRAPARLFALRLPRVRRVLRCLGSEGRCDHAADRHKAFFGKGEDGSWLTALEEVYPPALCWICAFAVLQQLQSAFDVQSAFEKIAFDRFPELVERMQCWSRCLDTSCVAADFHDRGFS